MNKKFLICIVGPTAIGKTSLSISLAQEFSTSIVSADSRQFFKEMNIGTAVPSQEELNAAPHHFIQHRSIEEPYSVGDFERDARELLNTLFTRLDVLILVGGSGLYVDAVVNGLDHFPEVDPQIRERLNHRLKTESLKVLQQELKQRDPHYYQTVDLKNPHRVIRALEICIGTQKPYSSFLKGSQQDRGFTPIYIGLDAKREIVYDRINSRVDMMMQQGLIKEAERLYPYRHLNALNTVGYKELFRYLDGDSSLEQAITDIKTNTRRFAKRQLTWYRKKKDIQWFDYQTPHTSIANAVRQQMDTDKNK